MERNDTQRHADKYVFWTCLVLAAGLFIGSFFCPPLGVIDASILKAGAILVGMQALGIVGQNLANGNWVTFKHGETEVTIGDDEDNVNK